MKQKTDIILLAAGKGLRTELVCPKQLFRLGGKPIFILALEKLLLGSEGFPIGKIILVVPERTEEYKTILRDYGIESVELVTGGKTRQESVYLGLREAVSERVLIHESARPFVPTQLVSELLESDAGIKALVPFIFSTNTLYSKTCSRFLARDSVYHIQLPQIFERQALVSAHELARLVNNNDCTDDSSLCYRYIGLKPKFIPGSEQNIKITTPTDLVYAEGLYARDHSNNRG